MEEELFEVFMNNLAQIVLRFTTITFNAVVITAESLAKMQRSGPGDQIDEVRSDDANDLDSNGRFTPTSETLLLFCAASGALHWVSTFIELLRFIQRKCCSKSNNVRMVADDYSAKGESNGLLYSALLHTIKEECEKKLAELSNLVTELSGLAKVTNSVSESLKDNVQKQNDNVQEQNKVTAEVRIELSSMRVELNGISQNSQQTNKNLRQVNHTNRKLQALLDTFVRLLSNLLPGHIRARANTDVELANTPPALPKRNPRTRNVNVSDLPPGPPPPKPPKSYRSDDASSFVSDASSANLESILSLLSNFFNNSNASNASSTNAESILSFLNNFFNKESQSCPSHQDTEKYTFYKPV
jgi:hypothetical protein